MRAFKIPRTGLRLTLTGDDGNYPLSMSAMALNDDGLPNGLIAVKGMVYSALPDELPVLFQYADGTFDIRTQYDTRDIAKANFVVSGSVMLVSEGEVINDPYISLDVSPKERMPRIGLGLVDNATLLCVVHTCTLNELALALHKLGAKLGMMGAYGDIYVNYPRRDFHMGTTPVTVLQAKDYSELPHPIVVIDPGHGGRDSGTMSFDKTLPEKQVNLIGAFAMYEYLTKNFEGTFLLLRDKDVSMSLQERVALAKSVGADFYYSCHSNGYDKKATGYESFTHPEADHVARAIQESIHKATMNFLAPYGVIDRGMKRYNFHVCRETLDTCPAVLAEMLFLDTVDEGKLLSDPEFVKGAYKAAAMGIAKGLKLQPKVVTDKPQPDRKLYKVQCGAFEFKTGAEKLMADLKAKGFSAYIKYE